MPAAEIASAGSTALNRIQRGHTRPDFFVETSEVAGASLEFALRGVAECTFVETSKPADATLEGAMKGIAECTFVQLEASSYSQLQHGRQRGVEQKERVPLQKADRTAQEERVKEFVDTSDHEGRRGVHVRGDEQTR